MLVVKRKMEQSLELRDASTGALLGHIHVLNIMRDYQVKLGIDLHPSDITIHRIDNPSLFRNKHEASSTKSP